MGQNFQIFSCRSQNTSIFAKRAKKGEESKIFKKFLAEHTKILPGSLKSRKLGQIFFQNFLVENILSC